MSHDFFKQPVLNSPYDYPSRHWELDESGQPTQTIVDRRRPAEFITPIPKPKKRKKKKGKRSADQAELVFDEGKGLSTKDQQYDHTAIINGVRQEVDRWRMLPKEHWKVTPETARLLEHWRHHKFEFITSHQIRQQADLLLGPEVSDVDGNVEKRSGTVSVFNGPLPEIAMCDSAEQEVDKVGTWLRSLSDEGVSPHETAIFVRSSAEFDRAQSAAAASDMPAKTIDETTDTTHGFVTIATMHRAKGLEYRAVAVMACDDEILPLQDRIENVADDADLSEVYETERHLLYVACTRARDFLHVSGVDSASEFLDDMHYSGYKNM